MNTLSLKLCILMSASVMMGCANTTSSSIERMPPAGGLVPCQELLHLNGKTGADAMNVLTDTGAKYTECALRVSNWIEWYHAGRKK